MGVSNGGKEKVMGLLAYFERRHTGRLGEDQLSMQQTGKPVSQRWAEHAEDEDERFTRA